MNAMIAAVPFYLDTVDYNQCKGELSLTISQDLARQIVALAQTPSYTLRNAGKSPEIGKLPGINNPHDLIPGEWAEASAAAGATPVQFASRPCGICGQPVAKVQYHDCKPVPLAKLEAMTAERDKALADLTAMTTRAEAAEAACVADQKAAVDALSRVEDLSDRLAAATAEMERAWRVLTRGGRTVRCRELSTQAAGEIAYVESLEAQCGALTAERDRRRLALRDCARTLQYNLEMRARKDERMMMDSLQVAWDAVGRDFCEQPLPPALAALENTK